MAAISHLRTARPRHLLVAGNGPNREACTAATLGSAFYLRPNLRFAEDSAEASMGTSEGRALYVRSALEQLSFQMARYPTGDLQNRVLRCGETPML
jgi:hypothetical protein